MELRFLARLDELKLEANHTEGIMMFRGVRLTNSPDYLEQYLAPIRTAIGSIEDSHHFPGTTYAYYRENVDGSVDTLNACKSILSTIQQILTSLWLVKDNSINTDTAFCYVEGVAVSMCNRMVRFSTGSGEHMETQFSDEELRTASTLLHSLFGSHDGKWSALKPVPPEIPPESGDSRLELAWYELQHSRSHRYVPSKIGGYCTVLEALLSTDSEEVSHKVSERCARLLGGDLEERIEIYRAIKRSYGARSRWVHGVAPSRALTSLCPLAVDCDNYVRRLLLLAEGNLKYREALCSGDDAYSDWLLKTVLQ